jgi:outer membrane cobalamin receptor
MSNYIFKKCSLAIAVCSAVTAMDINATQIDQTAETYEKIVVTGSRIPRANLVSASAVTVIDKKQ